MKFRPRPVRREVNISREHPLKEFFILVGGIVGGFLLLYVLLGLALDAVVLRIDPALEEHLGALMIHSYELEGERSVAEEKLQELLDSLVATIEEPEREYRVHISPSEKANAFALPGGHIVVLSGLVEEAESENELAMVLGHELGHFKDRDHLRGLGRGLVLIFISSLLFGTDNALSSLTTSVLGGAEMRFSQHQETQADDWGLALLVRRYGHAGGATAFFRRLAEKEEGKELVYLFASHPFPKERVESIEEKIGEGDIPVEEEVPLDPAYLEAAGKEE